jgi:hypothetical protein
MKVEREVKKKKEVQEYRLPHKRVSMMLVWWLEVRDIFPQEIC